MSTEIPATASSPQDFKKKKGGPQLVALPSGLAIKCKKVSLIDMMKNGDIPNALMSIVNEAIAKGEDLKPEEIMGGGQEEMDMDTIRDMYEMVDGIVCSIAQEPRVEPAPTNEADRRGDVLYVDELDDEDKMHLFGWATGGTKDLEPFRQGSGEDVDPMAQESVGQLPPESFNGTAGG